MLWALVDYMRLHSQAIAFNVMLLTICFLIARIIKVPPIAALAFGFLPLFIAIAALGGTGHEIIAMIR